MKLIKVTSAAGVQIVPKANQAHYEQINAKVKAPAYKIEDPSYEEVKDYYPEYAEAYKAKPKTSQVKSTTENNKQ